MHLAGFPVKKALVMFDALRDEDDMLKYHDIQRRSVLNYQIDNNAFYNGLVHNKKTSWENLPIITKHELQGSETKKVGAPHKQLFWARTSGSSGVPLVIAKNKFTHALIWANIAHQYSKAGIDINDLQARFYGTPLVGMDKFKEKAKDYVSNRVRFPVFDLSDRVMESWIHSFAQRPYKYLYGYSNAILTFALFLKRNHIVLSHICPTLKACIVTAEICSDTDSKTIRERIGVNVYNEYGATEVSVIGFKCDDIWEVSDELMYVEVVDDNGNLVPDGILGRLLCTLYYNTGTPIIRYEVGDMAAIFHQNGRTYISHLQGRMSDVVVLPSGRKVPGITFYYVMKEVLKKYASIKEFRIIQKGQTSFEMELAVHDINAISENEILSTVKKGFDTYIEERLTITMIVVSVIMRKGNGKFKHFEALQNLTPVDIG
jgi:phenylacetate-CoA ligase